MATSTNISALLEATQIAWRAWEKSAQQISKEAPSWEMAAREAATWEVTVRLTDRLTEAMGWEEVSFRLPSQFARPTSECMDDRGA